MKKFYLLLLLSYLSVSFCKAQLPTDSLFAYYSFCLGSINDATGNGYNLTSLNANIDSDRFNRPNSSFRFNGNGALYRTPFLPLTNDFTYSAWFNADTTQFGTIFNNGNTGYNGYGLIIGNGTTPYVIGNKFCAVSGNISYFGSQTITMKTWHHGVLVHSGNTFKVYLDTVLIGSYNFNFNTPTGEFNIGMNHNANAAPFNGKIDDVIAYKRALTFAEIKQLFSYSSNLQITSQPVSQSIQQGNTAQFSVAATGGNLYYQWQQNSGTGFVNLSNAGAFSGVTTNTLNISNVNSSLNNNLYRCIITSQFGCEDTSQQAALSVITDVVNIDANNSISFMPNPSNGNFSIRFNNKDQHPMHIIIRNALGATVKEIDNSSNSNLLDVHLNVAGGVYFYQILNDKHILLSKGKLLIQ